MLLSAAGCANNGTSTTSSSAPTKAEFIEQGDEILCTKTEEVGAATAALSADPSDDELRALVLDGVLPAVQRSHDGLAALARPAGDEEQIEAILTTLQETIDEVEKDPALLFGEPDPFTEADNLILDYGLTGCPA